MLYVDHARIPFRRMKMNHLVADTSQELAAAAAALNLPPGSIQHPNTPKEHLDVCESKRTLALAMGAKPIDGRELVTIIRGRRNPPSPA